LLFVLSKVLAPFAELDLLLLAMLILGLALGATRWRRGGRRIAVAATLLFLAIAALPMSDWALAPLEHRFPPPRQLPSRVDGIIALGGAIDPELTARYGIPSLNEHAERMTSFVALARRYPSAKLVFSAGSASIFPDHPAETDGARLLFAELGLDTSRVIFEDRSRNTYENAVFSKALAAPAPGETWLLVTSASHMPRSVGIFRAVNWPVVAFPVAYKTGGPYEIKLAGHLLRLDLALHEWIGLVAYRLLERTDALFPAP
jgi:uncharacterized SAM-binding protein YcdF (DUF218 family)